VHSVLVTGHDTESRRNPQLRAEIGGPALLAVRTVNL